MDLLTQWALANLAYAAGLTLALFAAPLLVALFYLPTPMRIGVWLTGVSVALLALAGIAGPGGYGLIDGPETYLSTLAQAVGRF